jgi:hypothetical protein
MSEPRRTDNVHFAHLARETDGPELSEACQATLLRLPGTPAHALMLPISEIHIVVSEGARIRSRRCLRDIVPEE